MTLRRETSQAGKSSHIFLKKGNENRWRQRPYQNQSPTENVPPLLKYAKRKGGDICDSLRYAGETANAYELTGRIRAAENDVLRQVRNTRTDSLVNPLLAQLDSALKTSERQYDPILDFNLDEPNVGVQDQAQLLKLTWQAVTNTYNDIIDAPETWKEVHLGPEEIDYLALTRDLARQQRQHCE